MYIYIYIHITIVYYYAVICPNICLQQQTSGVVYRNQSGTSDNTSSVVFMELLRLMLTLLPLAVFLIFGFKQIMVFTNFQFWRTYRYGLSAKCIANSMSVVMINGRIFKSSSMNLDNGIDICRGPHKRINKYEISYLLHNC